MDLDISPFENDNSKMRSIVNYDDDQLFEKKSEQQNEQEIEHEEIGIEGAEQEEDDSNKENSEQPLNLSSRRKREQSSVTVPEVESTKKKQNTAQLEFHWSYEELAFPVDPHEESFITVENILSPLNYFKKFFDDSLLELIVNETNRYSERMKTLVVTNISEMQDFLAIEILMGLISMRAHTDYWSLNLRFDPIANIMALKRYYQVLRKNIHFVDNSASTRDRYFKIRPVLGAVRQECFEIEEEKTFSVDEIMIQYEGTEAGSPFRNIEFSASERTSGLSGKTVIALAKTIDNPTCSVIYSDDFSTSPDLVHYLRNGKGILALETLRANRSRGCDLKSDKEPAKGERSSFDQEADNTTKVAVVKWYDDKSILLSSSYVDAYPVPQIKRYVKGNAQKTDVPCPQTVKHYNTHMGGVDLADMLVALYRTGFRSHRWYMSIISQVLDICINNAWLLYDRDVSHVDEEKKTMALKQCRYKIAEGLLLRGKKRARFLKFQCQKKIFGRP
ncbi:hypothetical protein JTB14_020827 [Gonioctena quinquepunctata]|nr:hypothetical protein JTB14_020827 [Gonioctena quinquepunctata]